MYRTFCHGDLLLTDAGSAEMAKLAENAYRDVNIAFANELSLICERLGLDVWEIRQMANHHPRVEILRPGPGVGGHCIAVDPWFIVARRAGPGPADPRGPGRQRPHAARTPPAQIVATSTAVPGTPHRLPGAVLQGGCRATCARAQRCDIVAQVAAALPDIKIMVVEPHVAALPARLDELGNVLLVSTEHAVAESDVIALLVDHSCFTAIKRPQLAGKVIYDTRGMWA